MASELDRLPAEPEPVPIVRAEVMEVSLPLREPFVTGFGATRTRNTVLVRLEDEAGRTGWGEGAALDHPFYLPETAAGTYAVLADHALPRALAARPRNLAAIAAALAPIRGNTFAKMAVEAAFLSLQAARAGVSLRRLLGGDATRIAVGESIGIKASVAETLEEVGLRLKEGYRRIKLKVRPGWDVELVSAVRAEFGDILLQVDANASYTLDDAASLERLDGFGLLCIEQPLAYDDIEGHARLQRRLETAICLDESLRSVADTRRALDLDACRNVNLKPGRVGGILASLAVHDLCRERSVPLWCGGMLESGIGRAPNIALCSLPGFVQPADMSPAPVLYLADVLDPGYEVDAQGFIEVSEAPGLGYRVDEERVGAWTVRRRLVPVPGPGASSRGPKAGSGGWPDRFAARTRGGGGGGIEAILALSGNTDVISFAGGLPDPATMPGPELGGLVTELIEAGPAALQYPPVRGLPGTLEMVAGRLADRQGVRPGPGELMITSGCIEALELLGKAFLDAGDAVAVESPTYLGGIMAVRGFEAEPVPIPIDGEGILVGHLEAELRERQRLKLVYTIPDHQNPTGTTMSEARRQSLVGLCRQHQALVVEDLTYRELHYDGPPLPSLWSLAPEAVVQIGTFSKTFFPGVRLGWAAGPKAVIAQMVVAKQNTDQGAGALGQRLLEEFARSGDLDRQIEAARAFYRRRRDQMLASLAAWMPAGVTWTRPAGGFVTWLTLPEGLDSGALAAESMRLGVAFVPGGVFFVDPAQGRRHLRLSFSGVPDGLIEEGVRRLAGLIREAAPRLRPAGGGRFQQLEVGHEQQR